MHTTKLSEGRIQQITEAIVKADILVRVEWWLKADQRFRADFLEAMRDRSKREPLIRNCLPLFTFSFGTLSDKSGVPLGELHDCVVYLFLEVFDEVSV